MILTFFLALGVLATVVPAAALGLGVAMLSGRLAMPVRGTLLVVAGAVGAAAWMLLIPAGHVGTVAAALSALATLVAGAAGLAWSARRRLVALVRVRMDSRITRI
ncbi:hypothetical protein ACIQI7_21800 [Kitasatospora sp. NPDC092039]|uniref:hypothetical protein n=1 Tax=Kitasatospora sp. NPDC092039 TaxID=3364086 RepID=UPI00382A5322